MKPDGNRLWVVDFKTWNEIFFSHSLDLCLWLLVRLCLSNSSWAAEFSFVTETSVLFCVGVKSFQYFRFLFFFWFYAAKWRATRPSKRFERPRTVNWWYFRMVRVRKIALLGFPAVGRKYFWNCYWHNKKIGKSSLAQQFVNHTFREDYCTTIENRKLDSFSLSVT